MLPHLRKHPVGQILSQAAMGSLPSDEELDELRIPAERRHSLAVAAAAVAAASRSGDKQQARTLAEEQAAALIDALPESRQDPDYLRRREAEAMPTDPRGLASRVPYR